MSENNLHLKRFTSKRYSEILSAGFSFFGKNWLKLILPFASFIIISIIITNILTADLNWQTILLTPQLETVLEKEIMDLTENDFSIVIQYLSVMSSILLLDGVIQTFFMVFSMCIFASYIYKRFIGESPSLLSEIKSAFNPKLIIVIILLGLVIPLGGFLLYIPSIIILGFYSFSIFTYTLYRNENPIKKARFVSKNSFWKVIGIFVINSIVILGINLIYQTLVNNILIIPNSWYNPASRNLGMIILNNILYRIFEILFSPLFICLLCSLYVHLHFSRAQETIYVKAKSISNTEQKGLYCPFCGYYIIQLKQYCPSCGKKLDFEI